MKNVTVKLLATKITICDKDQSLCHHTCEYFIKTCNGERKCRLFDTKLIKLSLYGSALRCDACIVLESLHEAF